MTKILVQCRNCEGTGCPICDGSGDREFQIVLPEEIAAIGRATTLAKAAAEWREAEADEWGSPAAESRKTGAICDLIDAIDAITDADLVLLAALVDGATV